MKSLKDLLTRVTKGWKSLNNSMKILIAIVGGSLLVSIILYFALFSSTKYETMFTNLSLQDSAIVVSKLDELKIDKYKLEDNGTTILVDESLIDKLRIDLAISGSLPNSSTGYELFDDVGIMMTDEDRKIMYQRALEGELQQSIMSLQEIDNARVHLVLAENNLFNQDTSTSSASIVLEINPYSKLTNDQIKGIIALVSGAVENLSQENIKVVDSNANLLSANILEDSSVSSTSAAQNKRDLESSYSMQLSSSITNLLEKTYGAGKAVVNVSVELNLDTEESIKNSYEGEPVVISEQKNYQKDTETGTGGDVLDAGGYTSDDDAVSDSDTQSYEVIRNYEMGQTTTTTIKAPGGINKISTSVIIDKELTNDEKIAIENIVKASLGADEARGDIVNVEGIIFDTTLQDSIIDDLANETGDVGIISSITAVVPMPVLIGILLALIIGIVLVIVLLVKNNRKASRKEQLEEIINNEDVSGIDLAINNLKNKEIIDQVILDTNSPEDNLMDKVDKYAKENSKEAAEILKLWILEGEE
jgi:flagellar M-ring protein FliF